MFRSFMAATIVCAVGFGPVGAAPARVVTTYLRQHVTIAPPRADGVAISYTVIAPRERSGSKQRERVLFRSGNGRLLVVDISSKSLPVGTTHWMNFYLASGGTHVNVTLQNDQVAIDVDGDIELHLPLSKLESNSTEFAEVRDEIPEGLLEAIIEFAQVGRLLEPAWEETARTLWATLLRGEAVPASPTAEWVRQVVVAAEPMNAQTEPLAAEQPYGRLFAVPAH